MLAQGHSSSAKRGGLVADASPGLIFLKKKSCPFVPKEIIMLRSWASALFSFCDKLHAESLERGDTSFSKQEMVQLGDGVALVVRERLYSYLHRLN